MVMWTSATVSETAVKQNQKQQCQSQVSVLVSAVQSLWVCGLVWYDLMSNLVCFFAKERRLSLLCIWIAACAKSQTPNMPLLPSTAIGTALGKFGVDQYSSRNMYIHTQLQMSIILSDSDTCCRSQHQTSPTPKCLLCVALLPLPQSPADVQGVGPPASVFGFSCWWAAFHAADTVCWHYSKCSL